MHRPLLLYLLHVLQVMAVLSVFTNIIIVFENSPAFCDMLGVDIESRDKWLVAFIFEHIIIIVILVFFAFVPVENKGISKLKNLSRTIKNFSLANGGAPAESALPAPRPTPPLPTAAAPKGPADESSRDNEGTRARPTPAASAAKKPQGVEEEEGEEEEDASIAHGDVAEVVAGAVGLYANAVGRLWRGAEGEWGEVAAAAAEAVAARERWKREAEVQVVGRELVGEGREEEWHKGKKASALHKAFEKLQNAAEAKAKDVGAGNADGDNRDTVRDSAADEDSGGGKEKKTKKKKKSEGGVKEDGVGDDAAGGRAQSAGEGAQGEVGDGERADGDGEPKERSGQGKREKRKKRRDGAVDDAAAGGDGGAGGADE